MSSPMSLPRHFINLYDFDAATLRAILDDAHARKKARLGWPKGKVDADAPGLDRTLAMIFEKNSTRTRFSFDAAIRQLGGDAIITTAGETQIGRGEPISDTARVLSRMVDAVMIRANRHADVEAFAAASTVPVINALTDASHPCQIMADLMTFEEHKGDLRGRTIAWVGDGNNVCASFIHAAPKFGFKLNIGCPKAYEPDAKDVQRARDEQALIHITDDPLEAVRNADLVVADTFVSMGDTDVDARLAALMPYQVNDRLMAAANPDAGFMHCLPAHRGEEVTDAILDGPQSLAWDEAENRIHAQKAILAWCFGG
jgi:ornithine carbamoyltransferase